MQILKKSERYSKSTGYRLGAFEGMFDSEYQAWSSARIVGKEQDVADWFKANSRCSGCIIAWEPAEYQKIKRVTTYGNMPEDAIICARVYIFANTGICTSTTPLTHCPGPCNLIL